MNKSAILFSSVAFSVFSATAAWSEVSVVTSIKPIHSLVAAVMDGAGTPDLLVEGGASPHTYSLKPSQAAKLEQADVIFWVGPQIETFLEKPIESIAHDAKNITLMQTPDLVLLENRSNEAFEAHDHDHGHHSDEAHHEKKHDDHAGHEKHEEDHADHGHGDEKHDDHASHEKHEAEHADHAHGDEKHHDHASHEKHEEDHADHGHGDEKHHDHASHEKHEEEHADHAHGDEKHDDHASHGGHAGHSEDSYAYNAHIWLDPENAKILTGKIKDTLVEIDPENAARYQENATAAIARLDDLTKEIETGLASAQGKGFVVFHDAYPYFENRFGVSAVGSITVSPEVTPGAERIGAIRAKVKELGATCVFAEPQFEPKLVSVILEGTDAKSGTLDPLGATLEAGPALYAELLRTMAGSLKECLQGQ